MNKTVCSIYKIVNNTNGKVYVGQTWITVQARFRRHKYASSNCIKLTRAIKKYGEDSFSVELITFCGTQEVADYLESHFINKFYSIENGYNILVGGKTGSRKGIKHSQETRDKLSKSATGRRHSIGTKETLSTLRKGVLLSAEHKSKLSEAKKGKKFTEEHKSKLLGNHKGMTWNIVDGKRVWMEK
jgi:group I intron endonuclease